MGGGCIEYVIDDKSCKSSRPVSPGSGEKFFYETDYQGAGAHPLEFKRLYRSNYAGQPRMAYGWTHNWQQSIIVLGSSSSNGTTVKAQRNDGTHSAFRYNGSTWATTTNNSFDTLTEIKTNGIRTGWQLKIWADDSVEHYNAAGQLLKIVQRNGWTTTVTYSTVTTSPQIAPIPDLPIAITNHFGRKLELRYNNFATLIKLIDPAGGIIQYGYDSSFNLTKTTWQDNTFRQYLYAIPSNGRLTGVIDEMGVRIGTYAYDAQGRVTSSEGASGADKLTFSYATNRTTIYEVATNTSRTHNFGLANGVMRPTSVTAPCPVCGSTASTYAYDANGNVTQRTEHDGTITKLTYDTKNRETSRVEAFGTAAATTYTTQWHATWNLPTLRTEPLKITAYTYDAKGNLTGQAETPTTDVNGAAGVAGLRDPSKPITSQGFTYSTANQIVGTASYTQIKNAQGVWISSIEANLEMTYVANGDLLSTKNLADNSTSSARNFDLNGFSRSLQLDAITAVTATRNSRQKLTAASISGAVMSLERDAGQRIKRVTLSNNNRVFAYAYDTANNLLSIADNWGNKLSFSFVNGVREDAYTHANIAAQSALGLKSLDPEYFDSLERYNIMQAMQELASLKSETTTLALRAASALSSLFAEKSPTVNFYGQSSLAEEGKGFAMFGVAHAAYGSVGGRNPLKCGIDCYAKYEKDCERCRRIPLKPARAICWAAAATELGACIARNK